MPKVLTVLHPEEIVGTQHPDITYDGNGLDSQVVVHTPYFLYTATMTRNPNPPYKLTRVDISLTDVP